MLTSAASATHLIEKLIRDHRSLEASAVALRHQAEEGECVVALIELVELHHKITRHDGLEENVLLPYLSGELPALGERVAMVRRQHRSCEQSLFALEVAIIADDDALAAQHAADLHALLVGNHTTEELALYACVDEMMRG